MVYQVIKQLDSFLKQPSFFNTPRKNTPFNTMHGFKKFKKMNDFKAECSLDRQ